MKGKGIDMRLIPIPLTITKVNITPDLKVANCYFLPFNTKLSEEEILKALEESKHIIRQYVTKEINLKYLRDILSSLCLLKLYSTSLVAITFEMSFLLVGLKRFELSFLGIS